MILKSKLEAMLNLVLFAVTAKSLLIVTKSKLFSQTNNAKYGLLFQITITRSLIFSMEAF